jgi:hypothetical protein
MGVLKKPEAVACSAFDELVVADDNGVFVFSADGEVLHTMQRVDFTGVAVHGDSVFAVGSECVVVFA